MDIYILSITMTEINTVEDDENILGKTLVKLIDLLLEIEAENPEEATDET